MKDTNVKIDGDIYEQFVNIKKVQGVPIAESVRRALRAYLKIHRENQALAAYIEELDNPIITSGDVPGDVAQGTAQDRVKNS